MIPFYKYFLKYSNREKLINTLYKKELKDVIMTHTYHKDEIYSLCEIAINEIIDLCQNCNQTMLNDSGFLTTYQNGTLLETVLRKNGENYDMMMNDWNDWMNYPVDDGLIPEEFCESAFLTMTFCGFTHKSNTKRINELKDEIEKSIKKIEDEKCFSMEEVLEHINQTIEKADNS